MANTQSNLIRLIVSKTQLFILLLTISQLIRVILFINVYGGFEHDGGWELSISRSLAEYGTYTTLVSTIVDPSTAYGINIDKMFDIQAKDGRIWLLTGNGTGPSSIIPDALVIKIFGTSFWALRAGPLIFYSLFLLLAAYIIYRLAGLGAVLLFHAFIFFYPHISIFLSYEAMGELPGMVYILWAYLAFTVAVQKEQKRWLGFLVAGLVVGLSLNAKLITLWSISSIFIWAGILWLAGFKWKKSGLYLSELLWLGAGSALPVLLWELVYLLVLTYLTNFELYLKHAQQRLRFILNDGSGLGLRIHFGPEFILDKFFLLSEVTHPQRWVVAVLFVAILFGGLALIWLWRGQAYKQIPMALIWLGWLTNTVWFVSMAKTGWPRHFWYALVLAIMILCIITVTFIRSGLDSLKNAEISDKQGRYGKVQLATGLLLLLLIGWGMAVQPYVWSVFLPDEIVSYWQQKQINNKYDASLPWIIIPRADQTEVVEYINQMPTEAKVYYPAQHKTAEIPTQTGRIQYPLNRRTYMTPHPADVVLIGPSLISPWKDPFQRQTLLELVERKCPHPAVKNQFYMICPIEDNLPQP